MTLTNLETQIAQLIKERKEIGCTCKGGLNIEGECEVVELFGPIQCRFLSKNMLNSYCIYVPSPCCDSAQLIKGKDYCIDQYKTGCSYASPLKDSTGFLKCYIKFIEIE